ncbi:MAG TPA: NAD-dependent epimerase/dehydratase family protein [Caulobacteraceae bacterium]|nr:NAD-dependent epimerase/dehydratase family protein [Caulobacteraceae bacterium]
MSQPRTAPQRTALVVGATGSFGAHAVMALIKRGWRLKALARDPEAAARKAGRRMPIEWIGGDAMNAADVVAAAEGCQVIVHAANPPGYRNWKGLVLPMTRSSIAAAIAHKARIVVPGNVYNYAPDAGPRIREDAPQVPETRKGRIRVEMEEMLRAAVADGARTLVIRAGDFFGPAAPNSALSWLTTRGKGRVTSVYQAGDGRVGHAFAYLPDLAEAMARLLDHDDELAPYETFHFAGHWLERSAELGEAIRRVTGRPKLPIRPFPWPVVYGLSPFVEMFRELIEMRYLWRRPIGLDNARLVAFLGEEPHTPLDDALRATLADQGLLEDGAAVTRPAMAAA